MCPPEALTSCKPLSTASTSFSKWLRVTLQSRRSQYICISRERERGRVEVGVEWQMGIINYEIMYVDVEIVGKRDRVW